jgi:DNA-binding transcriptional ArsR family regulator
VSFAGRSKDQDLIDDLARWLDAPDPKTARTNGHMKGASGRPSSTWTSTVDDEMIIEKCRAAKNAAKFEALFDRGDVHAYHGGDDSAADLALLSILAFYAQDEEQLERIFTSSALGQRGKWRRRADYRDKTIRKALPDDREVYDWEAQTGLEIGGNASSISGTSLYSSAASATPELSLVRFASRPSPVSREFIVSNLIPRHHPTTLYGWGGTAKSLLAALLGLSVAGSKEEFFGHAVTVHGPVLYLDFELDADEQHRRVMQLAAGMKMEVPEDFLYVSTLGFRTHEAVEFALSVCDEHGVIMVVLDSLGPAMVGDMMAARDVIEFHNQYIAPFKALHATPLLVDHQARQANGEGYQSKGTFGSAYKEHLSRSLVQVEAGDRSAEKGTLDIRLRHKKTNFGALAEPFDVSLSFSDERITATTRTLTPADRAQEATLNAEDRVIAALEDGPAYPDEITEVTGLARGTVKNKITALKKAEVVEATGEVRSQMEQVRLVALAALPLIGRAASATLKDPGQGTTLIPDEDGPTTVAGLFANPPDWLPKQIEVYRKDPARHLKPLCATVAAVILGDGLRGDEVRDEVERILAEGTQS